MADTVNATFTLTLTPSSTDSVTVNYTTVDGTAVAGTDYVAKSGTVTFSASQTTQTIVVSVYTKPKNTASTKFTLQLTDPSTGTILAKTNATCTIYTTTDGGQIAVYGPLINHGLITNAYNNEVGRGGYFHQFSGTSEGQSIMIYANFLAYENLVTGTTAEQTAAAYYKALALRMLDAMGDGTAGSVTGPMLRQEIPTDPETITMMHWLFAARGDIPLQKIVYDFSTTVTNGKLVIPAASHANDVYRIFQIYPATSYLLYNSPYSPSYDSTNPNGDTSITIDAAIGDDNWVYDSTAQTVTIDATGKTGSYYIVYGYNNASTLPVGSAEEAYPCWTAIDDGYAATAPDTFRWIEYALDKAIQYDDRSGKATRWTNLRNALRRSAVKSQNLTDLREIIKPLPQFDVIPISGEPSGMFCYSNHPSALPPSAELIAQGANSAWSGYNFWTRVGGTGGTVTPGAFTWTPDNMFYNPSGGNYFNGAIKCTVPSGTGQVQLGRGVNDSWRAQTSYQNADQYLFVALTSTKKPSSSEKVYIYMSSTKYYDADTRYYADIGSYAQFVANSSPTAPVYFFIPITDFTSKDSSTPVTLPVGTKFENFGISLEMAGPYTVQLVAMRLVSGTTKAWVDANQLKAVKGSEMPFFPGAMPFASNADTIKQQFVGWNGSPFHGYQLPDFWLYLASDVTAHYTVPLTPADLPIVDNSGAVVHTISATNTNGSTKPQYGLLMEQQLKFLQAAQSKYNSDGGSLGPFAHTFVMNTDARITIGNPTPNTWVYTNDDPNTRWVGYQVRVVESLARLAFQSATTSTLQDSNTLAKTMVINWLTWLNTAWPNLNGVNYTDPSTGITKLLTGMPTDFPDPRISAPEILYEETHAPAIIFRACLWLKMIDTSNDTLCNALMSRCWTYLESKYITDITNPMYHTWSPDSANYQLYGFWMGELVCMFSDIITYSSYVPSEYLPIARQRLVDTATWLSNDEVL